MLLKISYFENPTIFKIEFKEGIFKVLAGFEFAKADGISIKA